MNTYLNTLLKIHTLINENITYELHIHIIELMTVSLTYNENKQNTKQITCNEHSIKHPTKNSYT